ncbi:glycosyltransferase family 2 protein [Nocardioides solisilvae]|uniref:glycosyltransferase family 2 protein n=1 Tax=Nocardioides solisilvae TaxID=1542435 RepID=UPI000D750141|nr:glycosyltransferase family 2 protein [Nocardioides solisilvae]
MIVSAVLVSHDGARWLPGVLRGVRRQRRPVDRGIAVDTGSKDGSAQLVREAFSSDEAVVEAGGATSYPAALRLALEHLPPADDPDEWLWLLHDDSAPDPGALAALVAAAEAHPDADVLGPKLREWPSLRRLLELGVTLSGTGRRETGLERGEYDQGQHDQVRQVLAVNTAGMLVRRSTFERLGGLDEALPIFGNDVDLGWRAARAGVRTLVVPDAVVFHAEAAHRGVRRTPLTGRHTHYQERRAALFTLLANVEQRRLPWQVLRLLLGTLLRVLGFLLVRSVGEALDELAALVDVYRHPGRLRAARRRRAREQGVRPHDVRHLLAPWWLPYRHGLDFVSDLFQALVGQAQDVAERRRAARADEHPDEGVPGAGRGVPLRPGGPAEEDDEELYADTGIVVRFLTSPRAVALTLFVLLALAAARAALGEIQGGALSPAPAAVGDWWRLHAESWHPLGTGTDVPAPAYVPVLAVLATVLGGSPGAVVSALMLLAVPIALWGAWRFLRVVGRLVDPRGLPPWVLAWGATTYALVPATSGAWGEGRFGTVVLAGLLPWTAHAALGFADPEPDRRWRAAWRTGLLLALSSAFVPGVWLFGLLAAGIVVAAGFAISPRLLRDRSAWGPPALALGLVPLLLLPWIVPLVLTGSGTGLLLEAGRLPLAEAGATDLLTGRLGGLGAPWWLGAPVGVFALLALLPRPTRVPVTICWVIALAAAVVVAVLGFVTLRLPATATPPSLGFFVVVLQGVAVVATVVGAEAWTRRLVAHHPWWQRLLAGLVAAAAALVPLGGLAWWLVAADHSFDEDVVEAVPAYMAQSSLTGPEHGVLVVRGSVESGLSYRVRRGDGVTLGEDEVLSLADEDEAMTRTVTGLASSPTPADVAALGELGIEYVVLASPADGRVAAELDAASGLVQASAEDRATRAWRVDRPLDASSVESRVGAGRVVLLLLQGAAVLAALVLAAPTLAGRRSQA